MALPRLELLSISSASPQAGHRFEAKRRLPDDHRACPGSARAWGLAQCTARRSVKLSLAERRSARRLAAAAGMYEPGFELSRRRFG